MENNNRRDGPGALLPENVWNKRTVQTDKLFPIKSNTSYKASCSFGVKS
ncbi:hypothetical protein SBF1_4990005 [Candidatus Desulfosporosinus infrequens]|uniref:Uncharacterized protein n=1 Tax=Candidatus Desulfosporosinus infrequens TaxID=2043169 RepID=A0A2U3LH22_9FIRM|nr:hypothetical protein SBF1_4990005 [Candidatus Desulfosporosinus infrequens]